jgi:lipopolysaccharide export LptBFGC system permease protein LptF
MSIFEMTMLICFGIAWPFSIYKSYKSKQNTGKSVIFLLVVFIGYIAGFIHKIKYNFDFVSYLYALNGFMVFVDIILYYRNKKYSRQV